MSDLISEPRGRAGLMTLLPSRQAGSYRICAMAIAAVVLAWAVQSGDAQAGVMFGVRKSQLDPSANLLIGSHDGSGSAAESSSRSEADEERDIAEVPLQPLQPKFPGDVLSQTPGGASAPTQNSNGLSGLGTILDSGMAKIAQLASGTHHRWREGRLHLLQPLALRLLDPPRVHVSRVERT